MAGEFRGAIRCRIALLSEYEARWKSPTPSTTTIEEPSRPGVPGYPRVPGGSPSQRRDRTIRTATRARVGMGPELVLVLA